MAAFLTEPWFDAVRRVSALPARPGASASFELVVGGAPGGDVKSAWVVEDGTVRDATPGRADAPDATLTTTWADAVRMQRGELDPGAAFMQGKLKVTGDMGAVLRVLPMTVTSEYESWRDEVASLTEF